MYHISGYQPHVGSVQMKLCIGSGMFKGKMASFLNLTSTGSGTVSLINNSHDPERIDSRTLAQYWVLAVQLL